MELIKQKLAKIVGQAADKAQQAGDLPAFVLPEITIERPNNADHGDYATSLPLKLARSARMSPVEIAGRLAHHAGQTPELSEINPVAPGFINFRLSDTWLQRQVETVRSEGNRFGNLDGRSAAKTQIEFVSVNPTGPVHIGHGRGAVLGSTLANVLEAAGHKVQREYYVNDAGNQMDNFYRSLYARAAQFLDLDVPVPADGYVGAYMIDLAREILEAAPNRKEIERLIQDRPDEATKTLGLLGLTKMIDAIKTDLEDLGVVFDNWFSERSLFASGEYEAVIRLLEDTHYLMEKDGARWFTTTRPDETAGAVTLDKDNVLVRSNGTPTYFASDIAYHRNKFVIRGYDRVIDIWGADHHGHVSRMKAATGAIGVDPEKLTILLSQLVTLKRGGEIVRISKRTGEIITLREVIDEVGKDVCRFFLLSSSANSQMEFDLDLAKEQSQENPVYYVQYAHARILSILRLARERGIDYNCGDVSLLKDPAELALVRSMLQLPELVETMATLLEPHHLPHYAKELASAFHWFYKQCRVVQDNQPELTAARLKLVDAARITLARTLSLMGMSAPETM